MMRQTITISTNNAKEEDFAKLRELRPDDVLRLNLNGARADNRGDTRRSRV